MGGHGPTVPQTHHLTPAVGVLGSNEPAWICWRALSGHNGVVVPSMLEPWCCSSYSDGWDVARSRSADRSWLYQWTHDAVVF